MSEKLCTLRTKGGGGGKYTETSLWTNSAPTSNFAAQAVTLSDSMDNYKYLRVRYRMSTTDANEYSCIFLVNDIKHSSASTNVPQFSVVARTSTTYVRTFYYVSGTSLQMNAAYVMNNTGNVTNVAIPLEILGLNELDHGKRFDETVLWTNSSPTTNFNAQTVTLSDDIDNYDEIKINYKQSSTNSLSASVSIPVSDLKNMTVQASGIFFAIASMNSSNIGYFRRVGYASDTQIEFTTAYRVNNSGTDATLAIPTSIVGCKFR